MYVQGVSTRDVAKVMAEFGLKSLSSTQVIRAAALLDEELAAWRRRPLGEVHYLLLDARYEKLREGGVVRDAALFSAIGIGPDGRRCVRGVSCDPSEAEIHWRAFLDNLIDRGMRGVRFVVSDDHAGLKAARRAVLPGAVWQRCQFHLAQNAIHHAPNAAIRQRIGAELRRIWNASSLQTAQEELDRLVAAYRGTADRRLARTQRPRRPRRLHPAGAALAAHAYRQPDRAGDPAGDQTPHQQGPRLPQPRCPAPPRHRRPRRNRRGLGNLGPHLHQLAQPICLTAPQLRNSRLQVAQSDGRAGNLPFYAKYAPDPAIRRPG